MWRHSPWRPTANILEWSVDDSAWSTQSHGKLQDTVEETQWKYWLASAGHCSNLQHHSDVFWSGECSSSWTDDQVCSGEWNLCIAVRRVSSLLIARLLHVILRLISCAGFRAARHSTTYFCWSAFGHQKNKCSPFAYVTEISGCHYSQHCAVAFYYIYFA